MKAWPFINNFIVVSVLKAGIYVSFKIVVRNSQASIRNINYWSFASNAGSPSSHEGIVVDVCIPCVDLNIRAIILCIVNGVVVDITNNSIDVNNDNVGVATQPINGSFIMFAKDSRINLSGLVGYYAEAKFKNNSQEKAEMYSIGSEITPSSK